MNKFCNVNAVVVQNRPTLAETFFLRIYYNNFNKMDEKNQKSKNSCIQVFDVNVSFSFL